MSLKFLVTLGVIIGSTVGGYLPLLWGDASFLSGASIFGTLVGGLAGIWGGYKSYQYLNS